jgi:hypothetical protein
LRNNLVGNRFVQQGTSPLPSGRGRRHAPLAPLAFRRLYSAQGVPWGFFPIAIMLRLAGLRLEPAALGEIASIALLPWVAQPLLGPLVDRVSFGRFGRRRPTILISELGMALSLFALSFADPVTSLSLFGVRLVSDDLSAFSGGCVTIIAKIAVISSRRPHEKHHLPCPGCAGCGLRQFRHFLA